LIGLNKAIDVQKGNIVAKFKIQIDLLNSENLELNSRINYVIDNGITPENNFD